MTDPNIRELEKLPIPLRNGEVAFEALDYDGDVRMIRLKIREGRRFTVLELDPDTARSWAAVLAGWADEGGAG